MRTLSIVVSVVVLACLATVTGGAQRRGPEGFIAEGIPRMPNPPGPAPTRDSSGVWVGPQDEKNDPVPPMTPAGAAVFKLRKPYGAASRSDVGASNDPFITCDPLGFPRNLIAHAVSGRGRLIFYLWAGPDLDHTNTAPRREVWMDGRALPKAVDVKGCARVQIRRPFSWSMGRRPYAGD